MYDIIVRRFIAVFLPDCTVAKTAVDAEVENVNFVAKGKEILSPGWRILFGNEKDGETPSKNDEDKVLPSFEKGEHGPHRSQFY